MKRFLKNYTSNVPVSQTIYRIEQVLIKCGVTGISKEYGPDGTVSAVSFRIQDKGKDFNVRLPANKEAAQTALWVDYAAGDEMNESGTALKWSKKRLKKSDFKEQAERTAWKIIQDWVEVQMSMIQMNQAESLEVFMPYIWDGEQTVFSRLKASNYRGLIEYKNGGENVR